MELNITRFFNEADPFDYSASKMEKGENAGKITWNRAASDSYEHFMLDTEEKQEEFRNHVRGYGAWSDEEIAAWNDVELNALLIQMISGDMREAGLDVEEPDWGQYQEDAEAGRVAGSVFVGDDGQIYYYIGD